jgi:hypothetical protein
MLHGDQTPTVAGQRHRLPVSYMLLNTAEVLAGPLKKMQ